MRSERLPALNGSGMRSDFHLFGRAHLLILSSVLVLAILLARLCRRSFRSACWIRYGLGGFMILNELVWYTYTVHYEGFRFPEGLPLNLCDLTLWLTIAAVFTLNRLAFEIAYYVGVGGSGMALITPDLWAPSFSYPTVYFFLAHGTVVAALLMLLWSKLAVPRPGSLWRTFGVLNAYAAAIALFNATFKTNYMYLCEKPAGGSLLDFLGPWPFYVAACEVVALIIFWLLWLPVRTESRRTSEPI
jgi:hypothetical integral membrane protein (TIGR02206 family)